MTHRSPLPLPAFYLGQSVRVLDDGPVGSLEFVVRHIRFNERYQFYSYRIRNSQLGELSFNNELAMVAYYMELRTL